MFTQAKFWLKFSIINLFIVALLGLLMRYKIAFDFPFFNQKSVQHSHSHFAFSGWISHTLMVLLTVFLQQKSQLQKLDFFKRYKLILWGNIICAYGMLIAFLAQGYGLFSIFFSTVSIFICFAFGYLFWIDSKSVENNNLSLNWFKGALFFNVLSSLGTFFLAYMMITKNIHQNEYLASIYYYLHFQYNGWFFFACMGLLFHLLQLKKSDNIFYPKLFWLFFIACIPSYFLSILWLQLPLWIYILTVIAAFIQVYAWLQFLFYLFKSKQNLSLNYSSYLRNTIVFVAIALTIKLALQAGSVVPTLSQLAFGFRPIVIAYLHLVLLAVISLFLLFYIFTQSFFYISKGAKFGFLLFTIGVFLNELFLAIQGIASFSYTLIPMINELLFIIASIMVIGLGLLAFNLLKKGNLSFFYE